MQKIFIILFSLLLQNAHAGTHFKRVVIVVFENTDFENALKQPYFSQLAREGALATNYFALTHPSQPNYLGLIAGSTYNVLTDGNVNLSHPHLGDLLEEAKLDWRVYAEGYPGNCFLGTRRGSYVRKHVPFISFTNVSGNPARCGKILEASAFQNDFNANKLPAFSLYVPNLQDDGHDTNVSYGDRWLKQFFGPLLSSSKLPKDLLVIITFDEGSHFSNNKILTLFWGAGVKPGSRTDVKLNHYNMLRTLEDEFSLSSLGQNDAKVGPVTGIWK